MPKTPCLDTEDIARGMGREKGCSGLGVNCGVACTSFTVAGAAPVFIFNPLSVVFS